MAQLDDDDDSLFTSLNFNRENFMKVVDENDQEKLNKYLISEIEKLAEMDTTLTLDDIKFMIENGADPRYNDDDAFILSCRCADTNIMLYFINNWNVDINAQDSGGLYSAIACYRNANFKLLLECGIKIPDILFSFICCSKELIQICSDYVDLQVLGKHFIKNMRKKDREIMSYLIKNNFDFHNCL